jgi:hypothetical protein
VLTRVLACFGVAAAVLASLLVSGSAVAAARTTASLSVASVRTGAVTASTLTVASSARMSVTALRFRLPSGVSGRLAVRAAPGLGSGRLRSSGSSYTYSLSHTTTVAAGHRVSLSLSGWRNPTVAGPERVTGVVLVPRTGTAPAVATTNGVVIQGVLDPSVSADQVGSGVQLTWTTTLPAAPPYGVLSVGVPAELAGAPDSASVSGLGAGSFRRSATSLDYVLDAPESVDASRAVTVTATWSRRPAAARDIPLAVTAGDGLGSTWAVGGTRTPVGLQPAGCGTFRSVGWVTTENALPGDADWQIGPVTADAPRGYAGTTSAQCGDTVALHVSSTRPYRVTAYRMGWYAGSGARVVWQSDERPAVPQPGATVDPTTNMVEAPWSVTDEISIGTGWVPGDYLLELTDTAGKASYVPLTIRDDGSKSALLVQNSVLTWQAYNHWGGYSLYTGIDNQGPDRARVVSFDRPYAPSGHTSYGDGQFLANDYSFVRFAEKRGLDVSYWTDLDLDRDPGLLGQHKALVLLRHSEYWTQAMRDSVTSARDNGMNIAFLGANNIYWRARLQPDSAGDQRQMVVYRYVNEDPQPTATDATTTYRSDTVNDPEQRLVGVEYDCLQIDAPMLITDSTAWVFANTGLTSGAQLPDLIFQEYDRFWDGTGGPPVQVLAHSPLSCPAHQESQSFADMSYYTTSSGAGVFAVGTMGWEAGLDDWDVSRPYPPSERAIVEQITANVLATFAQGPAANTHPAVPNSAGLGFGTAPPPFEPETTDGDANGDGADVASLWAVTAG